MNLPAQLIGEEGWLVAIDILQDSVELVPTKVRMVNLRNVRVFKGYALNTGLDAESFQVVLLFGVIPAPMLPLSHLLPEMNRVLKSEGTLAVWPPVPGRLTRAIHMSGLFRFVSKQNGVQNLKRIDPED